MLLVMTKKKATSSIPKIRLKTPRNKPLENPYHFGKKTPKKKKILILVIFLTTLSLLSILTYQNYEPQSATREDPEHACTEPAECVEGPSPSPTPDPRLGILLMGYGGADHDGGSLTDTIMLSHINPPEKKATLISIPRDLWVPLKLNPEKPIYQKINAAYPFGLDERSYPDRIEKYQGEESGGQLAKDTVQMITGLPVQYYFAVSFSGFIASLNQLGPITISNPATFDDPYYPIEGKETDTCEKSQEEIASISAELKGFELEKQFECRYQQLHFDAGPQELDAETALKFVRSRHSQTHGGDFNRALRQQALIEGVRDKVLRLEFYPKLLKLVPNILNYIDTDISPKSIIELANTFKNNDEYQVTTIS